MSGEVVPEHGGILQIGLRITLLGMDKDGEFRRVSEEEDRRIVKDPIPISLFGVELNREASRIASGVRRSLFTSDCRKTCNTFCLLTHSIEHIQGSQITDVVRNLKFSICSSTLGMDDPFRNTFAIEVGEEINQVEILEEQRAILTDYNRKTSVTASRLAGCSSVPLCADSGS